MFEEWVSYCREWISLWMNGSVYGGKDEFLEELIKFWRNESVIGESFGCNG